MATTANFALRMTPELKIAAKALTEVGFEEPLAEGGKFNHIRPSSINEAILYLMRSGIRATLAHIERQIAKTSAEHQMWEEIVSFFISHPTDRFALPANFAEGSNARAFISKCMDEDPEGLDEGFDRTEATDEFAGTQRQLFKLIEAKGQLQRAL
jgi:hypothetical protein